MRLLATLAIAAGLSFAGTAPASATTTPFPVCQDIVVNRTWVGVVCADPNGPCVVYGGGYIWNLCVL